MGIDADDQTVDWNSYTLTVYEGLMVPIEAVTYSEGTNELNITYNRHYNELDSRGFITPWSEV